jgi:predicted DNA-binding protein (MmcQ/YjbR family)
MRAGWLWSAEDLDEEDPDEAHGARLALLCAACPAGSKTRARGIDAGILAVPAGGRGRPTFRAGKKLFAVFSGGDEHPFGVIFKPELAERPALVEDPRFYVPPYFGPSGWLALDFTAAPVDWEEVTELMESSYRQVALQRMLRVLDQRA